MAINTSLFNTPHSKIRSTLDRNLKASANSTKPNITFIELVQEPDFGSLLIIFGKNANNVNGIANATPKPNIP